MKNIYDIIFIGGGLSTLMFLSQYTKNNSKQKILVLEKNKKIRSDQTFCVWAGPNLFDIEKTYKLKPKKIWQSIKLINSKESILQKIKPYQYKAFDGNKTLQLLLAQCKNITYKKNIIVDDIVYENLFLVRTKSGELFKSTYLFDSRPPKNKAIYKYPEVLNQAFIGTEISVATDQFDDTAATLMNFQKSDDAIIFNYILPFSKKRALIETTFFTKKVDFNLINKVHKNFLHHYQDYKIIRKEKAILPMGVIKNDTNSQAIKIGISAGMIRPATGYSMQRIANWLGKLDLKRITQSNKATYYFQGPILLDWLDSIFLKVCYNKPEIGPLLFISLFKNANIFSIIRFLSDSSTTLDIIKIIWALPKKIMVKGLFHYYE